MDAKDIPELEDLFEEFEDPFEDLRTGWLQTEYVKKNIPFVEPQKIVLGKSWASAKRALKKQIVEIEHAFYYVPILETIEMQLNSKRLFLMVIIKEEKDKLRDTLEDLCDGSLIKSHPIFGLDEHSLKILIYYDDINVINHMTNKVHKLGLFYYQLANIERKYRSGTKSIHLFAICKNEYIKIYGMNPFLKPLVDDIKFLSKDNGHHFSVHGGTVNLRGAILAVLAGTPASQAVGGFKESVGGARRKCRDCFADFESMQNNFNEEDFLTRNNVSHENQLEDIEKAESKFLKEFLSKHYGVNTRSALLEAPYFDVTEQLPQELMHVFLEEIVTYELKFLLRHYMATGEIELNDLNRKIKTFPFGYSELKNRPAEIKVTDLDHSASTNLGQSAAQMWELTTILPFILYDNIKDCESCHWNCFLLLLEIMGICLSRKINTSSILYLKVLIRSHLQQFREIYNANIIPKQHYLIHIPSQILMFGPLISAWCMRFEAKHAFFKDISRRVKNFKNLPYTLAMCHQSMESADMISLGGDGDPCPLFTDDIVSGKSRQLTGSHFENATNQLDRFYPPVAGSETMKILECQSSVIHGTVYKPGKNNYLLIQIQNDNMPEFGRINKIWYSSFHGPVFDLVVMETHLFYNPLNAFQIAESQNAQGHEIIKHCDLFDFKVLHSYACQNKKYISLKGSVL